MHPPTRSPSAHSIHLLSKHPLVAVRAATRSSIPISNLILSAMSASSSSSLPVPADWPLPLMPCPFCGDEIVSKVARSGQQAGDQFYKCVLYDGRQCRFFEFQQVYCRRMTPHQIATARRQARMNPAGQAVGAHQANGMAQMVPVANHAQIQAQQPLQVQPPHLPPAANNLIAEAVRPDDALIMIVNSNK